MKVRMKMEEEAEKNINTKNDRGKKIKYNQLSLNKTPYRQQRPTSVGAAVNRGHS